MCDVDVLLGVWVQLTVGLGSYFLAIVCSGCPFSGTKVLDKTKLVMGGNLEPGSRARETE